MEDQKVTHLILSRKISCNKQTEDSIKALEVTVNKIEKKEPEPMEGVRESNRTTSLSLNDQLLAEVKIQEALTKRLNLLVCRLIRTI